MAAPPLCEIVNPTEASGTARLVVAGEVDLATADELREAIVASSRAGAVTIDLRQVDYMDSSGLRALVEGWEAATATGHAVSLSVADGPVRRLLEISGVGELFELRQE